MLDVECSAFLLKSREGDNFIVRWGERPRKPARQQPCHTPPYHIMSERDNILGRIREALKVKAPQPGTHDENNPLPEPPASGAREWLPPVGPNFKDWGELFSKNAMDLKTGFHLMTSSDEMRQALLHLRDSEGWKSAACHSGLLPDAICPALGMPMVHTDKH